LLRNLYITGIYLAFLVVGVSAPFVLLLGYVWVDTFNPQFVVYGLLTDFPVSLVMALAVIVGYLFADRLFPMLTVTSVLMLIFAVWVTLSTALWAEVPDYAWMKWNWAFKNMAFAAFIPLIIRSRVQIEAFLQIYVFSLAVQFLPIGIKTLISGGGYGRTLGILSSNSGLAEGSTIAAVGMMVVPIILYLRHHNRILPRIQLVNLIYIGMAVGAVAATAGTYERTGLVGMVVVGFGLWLRSRRKFVFGILGTAAIAILVALSSQAWNDRISTVADYKAEDSALGRILVWEWTLNYVKDNPFGGGFDAYRIDRIEFPSDDPDSNAPPDVAIGKAFHSIYFEVLGEQGWVGLALFLSLAGSSLLFLHSVARRAGASEEMSWCRDLAIALQLALLTLLVCGAFIGIAFQPMFYYLFALSACLRQHLLQVARTQPRKLGYPPRPAVALPASPARAPGPL
jgi:putative inorganic carbon (HCO3(-)) transporter